MKRICSLIFFICLFFAPFPALGEQTVGAFTIIPLGVNGGTTEGNLSAYLLTPAGKTNFVLLDAGTLVNGFLQPATAKTLSQLGITANSPTQLAGVMLNNYIKAYLISHAHLDHIAGLVLASPIDSKKNILGQQSTIDNLKNYIFNDKIWPNLSATTVPTAQGKYTYITLPLNQFTPIPETTLQVMSMPLSHGNSYPSTAFLIQSENNYLLYFGDTGADAVENSNNIQNIWQQIAPLIRNHSLRAIFIETSYSNSQADKMLYGHLTPHWLLLELDQLAKIVNPNDPKKALQGLPIVITHIKPGLTNKVSTRDIIMEQLKKHNDLGIIFVSPSQGQRLTF
jgi:3',5'-cyclic-nucleotide phosphodiesterase